MFKWFAVVMIVIAPCIVLAETRFISDELTVPLRRGPNNTYKVIHAGLPSGTPLEVITADDGSGFTQVKMQNGDEGWVPTQYLSTEPAARDRLTTASKRIESLTTELSNLRQGIKDEKTARNTAEGSSNDLKNQVKQLQTELAEIRRVSANAVATYEENKSLKEQNEQIQRSQNEQVSRIKQLESHELEVWLLTGGGLVVLGLIFGVVIKSRPKTRDGW
jgi:SH3 domain protein